jgi:hypothetical protein
LAIVSASPSGSSADDPRLLGQAEGPLADDVALDLAGTGVDGAGPAAPSMAIAISPSFLWYSLQKSLATEASGPGGRPAAIWASVRRPL